MIIHTASSTREECDLGLYFLGRYCYRTRRSLFSKLHSPAMMDATIQIQGISKDFLFDHRFDFVTYMERVEDVHYR